VMSRHRKYRGMSIL